MELVCPKCKSPIYSRKNKLCGRCGELLPKEFLFNEEQTEIVKKQMEDGNKRWRELQKPNSDSSAGGADITSMV